MLELHLFEGVIWAEFSEQHQLQMFGGEQHQIQMFGGKYGADLIHISVGQNIMGY